MDAQADYACHLIQTAQAVLSNGKGIERGAARGLLPFFQAKLAAQFPDFVQTSLNQGELATDEKQVARTYGRIVGGHGARGIWEGDT